MEVTLKFKNGASLDIQDAFDYYNSIQNDLADSFIEEIEEALTSIKRDPKAFQKRYAEVRIVFTRRFPYGIHYTLNNSTIYIHAVFHTSRKPKK